MKPVEVIGKDSNMNKDDKLSEAVELTDESLEAVSGGIMPVTIGCSDCGWVNVVHLYNNSFTCVNCGKTHEVMG